VHGTPRKGRNPRARPSGERDGPLPLKTPGVGRPFEVRVAPVRRPEPTQVDLEVSQAEPASIAVLGT
jgi:hypothetical protein